MLRFLMIGDIVGSPGRNCIRDLLPKIKENYQIDFVIANGENIAGGFGLTRKTTDELYSYEVDVITTGNHVWDQKEIYNFINSEVKLLRPANYPPGVPGRGYEIYSKNGVDIGIINLNGSVFINNFDCPFRTADKILEEIKPEVNIIVVDFHAEATSEKLALAYYLDGRVSAVLGTHTHVQTADERIFESGMGYITDIGMTGPYESVLGMEHEPIIEMFVNKLPQRFGVAPGETAQFNAVIIDIDENSGKCKKIERFQEIHQF